jgi:hypothetical protein
MVKAGTISLYVDVMLIETVLADPKFYKKGGEISDVISKIKDYFSSKYDPEHPSASVINELAPAVVWRLFSAMGFGKWGILVGLLMSTFHVDVSGSLSSIYEKVKEMISDGKKVSSQQIDEAVDTSVAAHSGNEANDGKVVSSLDLLPQARLLRLAMIDYEQQLLRLTKINNTLLVSTAAISAASGTSLLGKIFGLVMKIGLASAGFMVAGDIINHLLGRPSSLDGTYQAGKTETSPTPAAAEPSAPVSTQKKYLPKEDASLPSSMPIQNNNQNIEAMVLQFAKDTYSGLDGKEQLIQNSPNFQKVVHVISNYNNTNQGSSQTFIPSFFRSKKQLVDYFIDDVAKSDV